MAEIKIQTIKSYHVVCECGEDLQATVVETLRYPEDDHIVVQPCGCRAGGESEG